ncbi:hypothetical protein F4776DRAFT_663851 [Hypoxylon sp. NC0597]|nr:hypothetical protein F4776DRAFT_663851 [Hypoxylon sp. NC0597]
MPARIERKRSGNMAVGSLVRRIRAIAGRPSSNERRREELRQARREFRRAVRKGARNADPAAIRARARKAFDKREKLPELDIHILAAVEGVYIDTPGGVRTLADGLVARLAEIGGSYYFLAKNGYYYKSIKDTGLSPDLDFVVDTWVPLQVRILAQPYRQLCRK